MRPPRPHLDRHPLSRGQRGFTLLEVVLALSLALGLLAVALYFHQQITRLRSHILDDSARLAAVRLGMDRLALELRTAAALPDSFRGTASSLEFVRSAPVAPRTRTSTAATPRAAVSPYRRVRYQLSGTNDPATASVSSVERSEEPWQASASITSPTSAALPEPEPEPESGFSTLQDVALQSISTVPESTARGTVLPELRHLAFRYWDGSSWLETWTDSGLPRGVEVSLATDAPPANASGTVSPIELFRRIIALPTSHPDLLTPTTPESFARQSQTLDPRSMEEAP
jgi:prepilin-type N-terminal cleavage/methylation domain-containing protein